MMSNTQDERIERFKHMTDADPDNELGHFSLGKAYYEAGQFTEATASFSRAVELNPILTKAYQFLGEAYDKLGKRKKAIELLTRGVTVADKQGDRMPRDKMAGLLKEWGASVPEFMAGRSTDAPTPTPLSQEGDQEGPADSGFGCSRCGRPGGKMEKPPFKGSLGQKVWANVCQACWREWIPMGTKVINELGLSLRDPAAQDTYDQYMNEFLQMEER